MGVKIAEAGKRNYTGPISSAPISQILHSGYGHQLVIPSGWAAGHFRTLEKKDVILRIKENTWNTKFLYCKSKNSGGLSSGWRNFALDNKLQEIDVCLFEPSSAVNNSIVPDVNIFRVLQ